MSFKTSPKIRFPTTPPIWPPVPEPLLRTPSELQQLLELSAPNPQMMDFPSMVPLCPSQRENEDPVVPVADGIRLGMIPRNQLVKWKILYR